MAQHETWLSENDPSAISKLSSTYLSLGLIEQNIKYNQECLPDINDRKVVKK